MVQKHYTISTEENNPSAPLSAALRYAERGWCVLPLHSVRDRRCSCQNPECLSPGKHPRTPHGVKDATSNPATLRRWWKQWPDANVGIATGVRSGLLVLDIDPRNGGAETLDQLTQEHGPLPETAEVLTGGAGRHLYFQHDKPTRSQTLGPGVELKGDGAYVVAPPSVHVSGRRYEWELSSHPDDVPIAPVPAWILQFPPKPNEETLGEMPEAIPEGKRNETLTRIAGALRARGLTELELIAALGAINTQRCQPPLPEEEVRRIARSIGSRPPIGPELAARIPQAAPTVAAERSARTVDRLLTIVEECELFRSPEGTPYALLRNGSIRKTYRITDRSFRAWLAAEHYRRFDRHPGETAVNQAVELTYHQCLSGPERNVYTRVAPLPQEEGVLLDLGDESGRAVLVTAEGWDLVPEHEAIFLRPPAMRPLPEPEYCREGLTLLRELLNPGIDEDLWALLTAWITMCFAPFGPYPLLALRGEQGSAKSATARILKAILDPTVPLLRRPPEDERTLAIAVANQWILAIDNVNTVPLWMSDALSALITGAGFATRALYTDADEIILTGQRPVLITGITDFITRDDLLDRSIVIELPPIPEQQRISERRLTELIEQRRGAILGAVLDRLSQALAQLPTTRLSRSPRMVDFALLAAAAERVETPAWSESSSRFLSAYSQARSESHLVAIESEPIGPTLVEWLADAPLPWKGTASQLLETLNLRVGEENRPRNWPKAPQAVGHALRRLSPALRSIGYSIRWEREGRYGTRTILLQREP